jgi:hypothetical protein
LTFDAAHRWVVVRCTVRVSSPKLMVIVVSATCTVTARRGCGLPTIFGATLVVLAQLRRIDRPVWMYGELEQETDHAPAATLRTAPEPGRV